MKRVIRRAELAKRIDATGMTPFAFAKANGIVPESLRRWLNGQREPKVDHIQKLADALHCTVWDISDWVLDEEKIRQHKEQIEELDHLWGYLTKAQRTQILAMVRSIAEPAMKAEEEIQNKLWEEGEAERQ